MQLKYLHPSADSKSTRRAFLWADLRVETETEKAEIQTIVQKNCFNEESCGRCVLIHFSDMYTIFSTLWNPSLNQRLGMLRRNAYHPPPLMSDTSETALADKVSDSVGAGSDTNTCML